LSLCVDRSGRARARRHRARRFRRHPHRPLHQSAADDGARAHRGPRPGCARTSGRAHGNRGPAVAAAHARLRSGAPCIVGHAHGAPRPIVNTPPAEEPEPSFPGREAMNTLINRHLHLKKKLLASLIGAGVVSAVALPGVSWAQSANATLQGSAPPNAQITARNVATGAVRVTTSAGNGTYTLVGLPPGTYAVSAAGGSQHNVTLAVAATSSLDLTANAAPPAGPTTTLAAVNVSAAALLDVKTSEVGNTVSLHQIQTVPQITRNFLEFAD